MSKTCLINLYNIVLVERDIGVDKTFFYRSSSHCFKMCVINAQYT